MDNGRRHICPVQIMQVNVTFPYQAALDRELNCLMQTRGNYVDSIVYQEAWTQLVEQYQVVTYTCRRLDDGAPVLAFEEDLS